MLALINSQRGAGKVGCLVAIGVVVLIVLILGGTAVGRYNQLVTSQERIEAAWSEIDNQYKRRYDLIPQLVNTVKGAADFEKSLFQYNIEVLKFIYSMGISLFIAKSRR